jgi:hypothetical protein
MIEPTKEYRNAPAMQPEEVAQLICKAIVARGRYYAPWWLPLAELASVLLRWPWEVFASRSSASKTPEGGTPTP